MSKPKNESQPNPGGTSEKSNGFDNPTDLPTRVHAAPVKVNGPLHRRMDTSFLQYASYVIRDRAIANLADGLKPVQRRILWALHEKDDGKFIKAPTYSPANLKGVIEEQIEETRASSVLS